MHVYIHNTPAWSSLATSLSFSFLTLFFNWSNVSFVCLTDHFHLKLIWLTQHSHKITLLKRGNLSHGRSCHTMYHVSPLHSCGIAKCSHSCPSALSKCSYLLSVASVVWLHPTVASVVWLHPTVASVVRLHPTIASVVWLHPTVASVVRLHPTVASVVWLHVYQKSTLLVLSLSLGEELSGI